jgi:hypothetical protein
MQGNFTESVVEQLEVGWIEPFGCSFVSALEFGRGQAHTGQNVGRAV